MQVFHDEQKRHLIQPPLDERARGERDLALELLGLELAQTRLLNPKYVAEHWRDGLRHLRLGT